MLALDVDVGSSPLARGLPRRHQAVLPGSRIIPARAGFTPGRAHSCVASRDHPRSRGVYGSPTAIRPLMRGSSPLARGLRMLPPPPSRTAGIIPARAGFTFCAFRHNGFIGDHPRSRGVYTNAFNIISKGDGSSPLARGLLSEQRATQRVRGIIPARAGFTRTSHAVRSPASGSSPLARGLLERIVRLRYGPRIIPARAGFTWLLRSPQNADWDHPRSRGVYLVGRMRLGVVMGSSPLARGLHPSPPPGTPQNGIIPARAGFTRNVDMHTAVVTDHPRSRGVYCAYK